MTPEQLIALYPRIYHMAEAGSWASIRKHGLLSSNEVTRRSGVKGPAAVGLRRGHRPAKVPVNVPGIGVVVLRDQIPMAPARIQRALPNGVTAADWYELINERVFFWVAEDRLHRLLNGNQYGHLEHDVLTINTKSLVTAHGANIQLCHMNSGNTFPAMTKRSPDIFKYICAYEMNTRGRPRKQVVELTVLGGVLDIKEHTIEVRRMKGPSVLSHIPI